MIDDNGKPTDPEKLNATVIEMAIRLACLGLLLFLSFIVIRPFIEIVVLSVVLAVALYPFFGLVAKWLGGRRRLSAAVITILLLLIVFGPATWLGLDLVEALRTTYERIESGAVSAPSPPATVKTWPFIGEPLFEFSGNRRQPISRQRLPENRPLPEAARQQLAWSVGKRRHRSSSILCFCDHSGISAFALVHRWLRRLLRFYVGSFRSAATNSCNWPVLRYETCHKASSAFHSCRPFSRVSDYWQPACRLPV